MKMLLTARLPVTVSSVQTWSQAYGKKCSPGRTQLPTSRHLLSALQWPRWHLIIVCEAPRPTAWRGKNLEVVLHQPLCGDLGSISLAAQFLTTPTGLRISSPSPVRFLSYVRGMLIMYTNWCIIGSAEALPILCVRCARWERERYRKERERERERERETEVTSP